MARRGQGKAQQVANNAEQDSIKKGCNGWDRVGQRSPEYDKTRLDRTKQQTGITALDRPRQTVQCKM